MGWKVNGERFRGVPVRAAAPAPAPATPDGMTDEQRALAAAVIVAYAMQVGAVEPGEEGAWVNDLSAGDWSALLVRRRAVGSR